MLELTSGRWSFPKLIFTLYGTWCAGSTSWTIWPHDLLRNGETFESTFDSSRKLVQNQDIQVETLWWSVMSIRISIQHIRVSIFCGWVLHFLPHGWTAQICCFTYSNLPPSQKKRKDNMDKPKGGPTWDRFSQIGMWRLGHWRKTGNVMGGSRAMWIGSQPLAGKMWYFDPKVQQVFKRLAPYIPMPHPCEDCTYIFTYMKLKFP